MSTKSTSQPAIPARVQAAIDFLEHCRWLTEQDSEFTPPRKLTPLEQSVADAALRVLGSYFHGEMDFGDTPPRVDRRPDESGGDAPAPVPTPA